MNVLAIDVGSSSVKLGLLRDARLIGDTIRQSFPTDYHDDRAEVAADDVLNAIFRATCRLPISHRRKVDFIALSTMSPSWIAMDRRGHPLTPIITHQDRRSQQIAIEIEHCIGKRRHLRLAGNRPIPGGISSTTCAWFVRNERSLMGRADLVGHLQTFLHRQFCGTRIVDPSHASFMGLYSVLNMGGWVEELCDVVGLKTHLLPEIRQANDVGGRLLAPAARRLGLPQGTPMLVGMIDTGAAMLLAGAAPGQLVNVVGSTDVLALCTEHPKPHERLLTRALGVGRRWLSVGTIAAAGSSLTWTRQQLFSDLSEKSFFALVSRLARSSGERGSVRFEPYLAGDRCSVEQRRASIGGLTLSSTRRQILAAIVDSLARASAERIDLLKWTGTPIKRQVMISGGGGGALARIMHRDWPGRWSFRTEAEATMRGLAQLVEQPPQSDD